MLMLRVLLACVLCLSTANALLHEDLLAKPYFDISFPDKVISTAKANELREAVQTEYKYRILNNGTDRFLCAIPNVTHTREKPTAEDRLKLATMAKEESTRASVRGQELLSGIEGTCLYWISGYWTYKFCYGGEIIQFHALPHAPGIPWWPPRQDTGAAAYSLGKWSASSSGATQTQKTNVKVNGDSKSLVMHYTKGTYCPLIGAERSTEVQFQCSPTTDDRIISVKETTSCQYLIVIQTARLCNDVAFKEPSKEKSHGLTCTRISDERPPPTLESDSASQDSISTSPQAESPASGGDSNEEAQELLMDKKIEQELSHLSFDAVPDDIAALARDDQSDKTAASTESDNQAAYITKDERASAAKEMALEIANQLEEGVMQMNGGSIFDAKNENVEFDVELQDENGELLGSVVMKVVDGEVIVEMDESIANAETAEDKRNDQAHEKVPPQLQAVFDRFVNHEEL